MSNIPQWDLSNVFPALESPEFEAAVISLVQRIDEAEALLGQLTERSAAGAPIESVAATLGDLLDCVNLLTEGQGTLRAYIESFVSTDSRNAVARRKQSEFDPIRVRRKNLMVGMQREVGALGPRLEAVMAVDKRVAEHAFALREMAEQSRYQMSDAEEALAAELTVSGADAWQRLQESVTSQLSVPFEVDGELKQLPMPALINLRSHPDEATRHRAWEAENMAWEGVREPLSAALNGVKGAVSTLDKKRGRRDALHAPLDSARIDQATLDAMLSAMEASFPTFRRYFAAKAQRIGKQQLAWWDLFAPTGRSDLTFTWDEAQEFIVVNFATFSDDLAALATRAFDSRWIDAEPRSGKRGGAFCMRVPGVRESRILANFDGSLDQVSTLAHELGHAYHNECIHRSGKTMLNSQLPMTVAETASIMCETIVMNAVLDKAGDPQSQQAILETMLIGDAQVIVDIYSRFQFEQEVMQRRARAELTADELNEIMERAQATTYGDALDERFRQKWMWTWKPHYYSPGLSFYNFPYAFGLLFATGLYAIYKERGSSFVPDYQALLASTGEADAATLAARFGIDLRSTAFWEGSLAMIGERVNWYCAL